MWKWFKDLFCRHTDTTFVGEQFIDAGMRKIKLFYCKNCHREIIKFV